MGIRLQFRNITKRYGSNTVVKDATFTVESGELFTLLGPSGCGKTTLLRMIAGFNSIEGGEILFNEEVINHKPAHLRNIGMVFQNYAVFPHMTVAQNVAYGLKARRLPRAETERRIEEAMELVKITPYRDRLPANLSGGQQQRVALARAIVIKPDILLMDEPLSNLDAKLRVQMRTTIRRIQAELGITTVYVTHDQEEALAISDRIAVMNEGRVLQIGRPETIYGRPSDAFVASFIGVSNPLKAEVEHWQDGVSKVALSPGYRVDIPGTHPPDGDRRIHVSVRPDDFRLCPPDEPGIPGEVVFSTYLGSYMQYLVKTAHDQEVEVWHYDHGEHNLARTGSRVSLQVTERRVNLFNPAGSRSLMHLREA